MDQKERTGPAQGRSDNHLSPMVPPPADDEWIRRLAERVDRTVRRRAAVKAVRRELALARHHGLAARHAAKLRRSGGGRR